MKKLFLFLVLTAGVLSVGATEQKVIRFFWSDGSFDVAAQDLYARVEFVNTEVHFVSADGDVTVYPMADLHALAFTTLRDIPDSEQSAKQPLIRLYPNPAQESIVLEGIDNYSDICVYDLEGRLLLRQEAAGNAQIDISSLSAGVYVLRVNTQSINFIKH